MEEINLEEIYNKIFYIVDCENFIFYPKAIIAIGFEISPYELNIITNETDILTHENRRFPLEYLEKYKSFEEAKKEAERLNNLPKNKKIADDWNSPEAIFKRKLLEESIKESESEWKY